MTIEAKDNFLVAEIVEGNTRAFEKVFRDHYANLCRYACSVVRDEDKAQSLVQNVFVKVWEYRSRLGHVRSLLSYLTAMVRNEAVNYLKHEKRQVRMPEIPEDAGLDLSTENHLKHHELQEQMILAIGNLPDRCREAFELSRFENLSNREIAGRMNISIKGVEALLTRSMKILRTELSEFLPSRKDGYSQGQILFMLLRKVKQVFIV